MKICPKCSREWEDQHTFCGVCGEKLEKKPIYCANCGSNIESGQRFCGTCGVEVPVASVENNNRSDDVNRIQETLRNGVDKIQNTVREQVRTTFSEENINRLSEHARNAREKIAETTPTVEEAVTGIWGWLADVIVAIISYLRRIFPHYMQEAVSDDEKYRALFAASDVAGKRATYLAVAYFVCGIVIFFTQSITLGEIAVLIIGLLTIFTLIYVLLFSLIYIKDISRVVIGVFLKISAYLLLTLLILALSFIIPFLPFILIGMTIYKNSKRREFLSKYKRYTYLFIWIILMNIITSIPGAISGALSTLASVEAQRSMRSIERGIFFSEKEIVREVQILILTSTLEYSLFCFSFGFYMIFPAVYFRKIKGFYKKEQEYGMKYDNAVKLMWLVPVTWLFLMFSVLSLAHFDGADPEGMLADCGIDVDSSTRMSDGTAFSSEVPESGYVYSSINESVMYGSATSYDMNNANTTYNNISQPNGTSHDFTNDTTGTEGIASKAGFLFGDTSFNFASMDGLQKLDTDNGFIINDRNGATMLRVDENGLMFDHSGHHIASIHNDRLVDIHTGETIVWKDNVSGCYRDGLSQILDVHSSNDGVFQTIKDVHGNGIEIINGWIYDAKTHVRIGSVGQV